ncbi:MAG: protein-L-isoaspartate(D-aspartate) O-methyltransferase [Candidatus Altiarchaeota archaeon]
MDCRSERLKLVEKLKSRGYLKSAEVIEAFKKVPREEFVPDRLKGSAYVDSPLPIGSDQTISAPHMVAIMTEALEAKPTDKVLEIGAGSGYQAAILAEIVTDGRIYTIERITELAFYAREKLKRLGYANVEVRVGDGTLGLEEQAPYDRIIVTAGSPRVPEKLVEQLAEGGRLLVPAGGRFYQNLIRVDKREGKIMEKDLGGCVFVPLIGKDGW